MHWSERIAQEAIRKAGEGKTVVVNSGVSLSAPVHIGHSREFITAALVASAVEKMGHQVKLLAYADDLDPLRKVYGFLPSGYARWVGCPLCRIPDPEGCHENYAEHHLDHLLKSLTHIGIRPKVVRSSALYREGECAPYVQSVLNHREHVNRILDSAARRQESKERWFFAPECPSCSSITDTVVQNWDGLWTLRFRCTKCNQDAEVDIRTGGGKLVWRADWPMRWSLLGVTVEPFGQDHGCAGGSYETASRIIKDVFSGEPPVPVPYAWLHLKSGEAMHSTGSKSFSVEQAEQTYPNELLWWIVAGKDPSRIIRFDPIESQLEEARILRASESGFDISGRDAVRILRETVEIPDYLSAYPRDHLVLAAQLGDFDPVKTLAVLKRNRAYSDTVVMPMSSDLEKIRCWLDIPNNPYRVRVRSLDEDPPFYSEDVRVVIDKIARAFVTIEWVSTIIHNTIHETIRQAGANPAEVFAGLYLATVSQTRGPRLGYLFESIGREQVLRLLA